VANEKLAQQLFVAGADILLTNKRGDWTKGVIQVLPVKWRSSNTNKSATRANFSSNFETCESLRVELLHASIRMPKLALIAKLSVWKDFSVL